MNEKKLGVVEDTLYVPMLGVNKSGMTMMKKKAHENGRA